MLMPWAGSTTSVYASAEVWPATAPTSSRSGTLPCPGPRKYGRRYSAANAASFRSASGAATAGRERLGVTVGDGEGRSREAAVAGDAIAQELPTELQPGLGGDGTGQNCQECRQCDQESVAHGDRLDCLRAAVSRAGASWL